MINMSERELLTWKAEIEGKHQLTLELPETPENVGYFFVTLSDGRKYTIYGLEEILDEYIHNNVDGDGYIGDVMEAHEENTEIETTARLLKLLGKETDDETAIKVLTKLREEYDINPIQN